MPRIDWGSKSTWVRGNADRLRREMWAERFLAVTGIDDPWIANARVSAFQRMFLAAVATGAWIELPLGNSDPLVRTGPVLAVALSVVAAAGWTPRFARPAAITAFVLVLVKNSLRFPILANHQYVEMLCLLFLVLFNRGDDDQEQALLQSLRWILLIGLLWSGLSKLTYGYYFRAEFFAAAIATEQRFAAFFRFLLPADDTFTRPSEAAVPTKKILCC